MNAEGIIKLAVERMKEAVEADRDNREEALNDLENLSGLQWPEAVAKAREDAARPVLTINRLPQFVRQVTGDLRNLNPAINVIPGDDGASDDVAEIIEGLVRQIQYNSDASSVFERAGESAAQCGMGWFRIITDYEDEMSFNQVIRIESIMNPFSVYMDPQARLSTREDADYCFITEQMKLETFQEMYPGKQSADVDVDGQTDGIEYWQEADEVIVAEYFWKEPVTKRIVQLADGSVLEDPKGPVVAVRERTVESHRVMWAKVSGKDVLEGPQEIPGKYIPVVGVMGEELHVGPERIRTSVIRFAKDPQRLYNYWRSAQTELVALQPKAPYIVSTKQIEGLEAIWQTANDTNRAYLPYLPDPSAPPPQRATPPIASQGMMQEVMTAAEDMKATTGVYDAALGNRSGETSGVAIRQRQLESDVSTSIYADNVAKAVAHAGRIIVAMIPEVYDTARMVRVLGKDDSEKAIPINGIQVVDGQIQAVNDLTSGRYDVRVSVGPNYSTKRQETAESMIEFVRAFPAAGQVTADLVAKNMDWPGADQFAERLKKLLPPGVRDTEDLSPEEQQQLQEQMQQQMQIAQMEQQGQMAEIRKVTAEASEAEADAEKARFEAIEKQLEVAITSGMMDAAIQQAVARALQGAMQPSY